MVKALIAISFGASAGAVIRWLLGLAMNPLYPLIPLGTLAANLIGGYLVGIAFCAFAAWPGGSPEWRLCVLTGFLGALTTFSTFSLEVTALIQQEKLLAAMATIAVHVCGSILMTFLGMASFTGLRHLFAR